MHGLPVEGVKRSQGITARARSLTTPIAGMQHITNADPWNHQLPFLFFICYIGM